MGFSKTQKWIREAAPTYMGNMTDFMYQLSLQVSGADRTDLAMEAADFVKDFPGASDVDKATARGFATAFGRPIPGTQDFYTFTGALYLKDLSARISNALPPNYQKATQFNEEMLKAVIRIQASQDEKIIMLDFLGVSLSNAIVKNADAYAGYLNKIAAIEKDFKLGIIDASRKYQLLEEAKYQDPLTDPQGTGAWLK